MQETRWARIVRKLTEHEIHRVKLNPKDAPSFDAVFSQMEDAIQQQVLQDGGKTYEEVVFTTRIIRDPFSIEFKAEARYLVGETELPFYAKLPWPCNDKLEYNYILSKVERENRLYQANISGGLSENLRQTWASFYDNVRKATEMNFCHIWTEWEVLQLESWKFDYWNVEKVK